MTEVFYVTKIKELQLNSEIQRADIKTILNHDTDVYTTEGKLLLRFRKNVLNLQHIDQFNQQVLKFACTPTTNRGSVCGSNEKSIYKNPKIYSNIIGYYDKLSPSQKCKYRKLGIPLPDVTVRECRFTQEYPEKYKRTLPLLQEINTLYKQLVPDQYHNQYTKALQTPFCIADTSFTTVTLNVNFQTRLHKDMGDDKDGFGNVVVIENGGYSGGETCFPEYGIGVNVRTGDVLFMDVHQRHGNLPILLDTPESKRLSLVCYLRKSIWKQTKGKTQDFRDEHVAYMKIIKDA
jgi:hypothetical protein